MEREARRLKRYVGYVWIGDQPGMRLDIVAYNADEARAEVEALYGQGHVVSLWNEEDRNKPRGVN
jgi:hypothetical protein